MINLLFGGFHKWRGVPQNRWFRIKSPIKMDDLEVDHPKLHNSNQTAATNVDRDVGQRQIHRADGTFTFFRPCVPAMAKSTREMRGLVT